jgi:hypothetical protein
VARFIHAIDQYEKHQTNKAQRQGNGKEIEFGLETYEEIKEAILDDYYFSHDTHLEDKRYKLELQWSDYK